MTIELATDGGEFVRTYNPLARTGGGGPDDGGMEFVKARLEEHERRFDRMEKTLDAIRDRLAALPTVNGLWGMIATVLALSVTIVAMFVGVLAYLQDQRIDSRPAAPQGPVNFYIQAPPAAPQLTPSAPQPEAPRQ